MLQVTTLRRFFSIRTAAAAVVLALLLGFGAAAPAAASAPDGRGADGGWSEPWGRLGSVIARWLGLAPGSVSAGSDGGPEMDPNGFSAGEDDGPGMDPDGLETDGGPEMDPNG
jgi:hypothetical protein